VKRARSRVEDRWRAKSCGPDWSCSFPSSGSRSFFLVPFLIVLKIKLVGITAAARRLTRRARLPPDGKRKASAAGLSFENYSFIASDWLYLASYPSSLVAAPSTNDPAFALDRSRLPMAWVRAALRGQPSLFMLVVLPF